MMIACGDFVIPGNKMPPNNAEAEAAYAIFIDMIENGLLTVSSESLGDGKTRIRWELLKEQEAKTGHWIESAGNDKCSICGTEYSDLYPDYGNTHFCPNCGATMEGR